MSEERLQELSRIVSESMGRAAGDRAFAEVVAEVRRLRKQEDGTMAPNRLAYTAQQLRCALGDALETNFDEGGAAGDMTHRRLQKLWDETAWVEEN